MNAKFPNPATVTPPRVMDSVDGDEVAAGEDSLTFPVASEVIAASELVEAAEVVATVVKMVVAAVQRGSLQC